MVIGKPAPCVRAFVDTVDEAIRAQRPSPGMSTMPRAWLACWVTAVLVTNAMCWARVERARLGTASLAALSWMVRHRKIPWDERLGARGRVLLRHDGLPWGSLVIDDTDHKRSKSANTLAHRYKLRDQASGGDVWGPSLLLLLVVTPPITLPVGLTCYPPAPELSAWSKQEKARTTPGVPPTQRPPPPPPTPHALTKAALALRLGAHFHAPHPTVRVHGVTADALSGTATCVDGASALFGGVQVSSPGRSHQHMRALQRAPHVADSCATHPGTPQNLRIRGGVEVVAIVARARLDLCAHHPNRLISALQYTGEERSRELRAADLTWRTLDMVQAHPWRWLVEVFLQDGKSQAGWSQLTTQPGTEGARHGVILRLLVAHGLVLHPDPQAQRQHNLPASTVGSLRAHVPVDGLVHMLEEGVSSDDPQSQLHRFTRALDEVLTFGRSTKHLSQHQLGRLEPTPSLKYRADKVMRHIPVLST